MEEYTGAIPAWTNHLGEQVYQVFFDYIRPDGQRIGPCHEFMTAYGSDDVKATE